MFWESLNPSPTLHSFPTSAKPRALNTLVTFYSRPQASQRQPSHTLFWAVPAKRLALRGRLILGNWSLSSVSSLGRQINLVDSYFHYHFSFSYHLLFSVFLHFLSNQLKLLSFSPRWNFSWPVWIWLHQLCFKNFGFGIFHFV